MFTYQNPRERGSAVLAFLLVIIGALSIFGGAMYLINQNTAEALTCGNAQRLYKEAKAEIKEVAGSDDLSSNEKREQLKELRKERDAAGDKIQSCAKGEESECESEKLAVGQARTDLDNLDRADYTSGDVGGAEFTAEQAKLAAAKLKADKALAKCVGENAPTTTEAAADEADGGGTGTRDDPCLGTACNTDPVVGSSKSWTELGQTVQADTGWHDQYWPKLQDRNGIKKAEHDQAAAREKKGQNLGVVLISNTDISDADARKSLADQGVKHVEDMPILRVNGFWNTRGLSGHRMERFWDPKSQVRLLLLTPHDYDAFVKDGVAPTKGVLGICGNGVDFGPPPAAPVPEQPPVTAPPVTSPPVTSPPVTSPPVTQPPPTSPPPVVTTTQPPPPPTTTTTTKPPKLCGGAGQPSCTGTPSR